MYVCRYGLAFWYGARLVREKTSYDGGIVMNVIFGAIIGGFAMGMAIPNLQYLVAGTVAGRRLFDVIDRTPAITSESSDSLIPDFTKGCATSSG
jgi:hypothetical protein